MDATTSPTAPETHDESVHVVDRKVLIGVAVALVSLTVLTVAVTHFDFGSLNIWVAMGIAAVKATLVALYFMHLRYDKPFYAIVFICAITCLVLFIGLALLDTEQYHHNLIPDYAPALER